MRSNEDALRRGGGRQDHQRCLQQRCNMERRLNGNILTHHNQSKFCSPQQPRTAGHKPPDELLDVSRV